MDHSKLILIGIIALYSLPQDLQPTVNDTVNHSILISKLYKYDIQGPTLEWFKSYQSNRQQYVQIHKTKSDTKPITCGIPQGSILGPILFIIYINDFGFGSSFYNSIRR